MQRKILVEKLKQILAEDVGEGDVTSAAVVPEGLKVEAVVVVKEAGVIAGIEETVIFGESLGLSVKAEVADGNEVKSGTVILKISGSAMAILSAERTILNLLSRMSGIATATRRLTEKLRKANLMTKVAATRKTAPGLLYFDKKAVVVGGGEPHRLRLDDMILLKDNHVVIAGSVENAVKKAKAVALSKKIEAEVTSIADALKAAEAGADIVMLDNFSPKQVREAVELLKESGFFGKILLEVSGGITEQNLLEYALAEVDVISIGALTHSVKALDISLEIVLTE
ncbi:nicotinate-nucleotide pyrophosphorylase [miscellaneous Crenarchaeota group-1 archaeon SG8-32-3]|uniref:Nicotinate-nucleotide pyrophosphorylase [carboxylating] n=1 Tax=miscellaneous Crenarchaeota group-1 archaeon SG8-32-3 TaxID=1685125 RepID=A0A0M0BU44_9ARCH|nr:MAG: nicotinate-nucleotide pyrophosphorylase [miscellaneous Crenarchaeota group-1 archaeon SG8-32-3]